MRFSTRPEDKRWSTELVVVGGGPGGYSAAIRASHLGVDTVLVEEDALGGTCLNEGCIPSKALISATRLARRAESAGGMGVHADVRFETDETYGWKDEVVEGMRQGVGKLCKANGVTVVEGRGEFADESTVRVEGDGATTEVGFENAVVATGSRPIEADGFDFDGDGVLDSADALAEEPPEELVVVGAGYIGMELSTAFSSMGCEVTVVEAEEDILPGYDRDLARPVVKKAHEANVELRTGEPAVEWDDEEGQVVTSDGRIDADGVLVAVGRRPCAESVEPEKGGVETDERGFVRTEGGVGQTTNPSVYAVGDVSGEPLLAHTAAHEGVAVAETVAGVRDPEGGSEFVVPKVVYTSPEIATVGMSPTEAREEGHDVAVGEFRMGANGRALTLNETEGFVRVVVDDDTRRVLGGQAVCAEASELVAEIALAVETGATADDVARTVHAHPTLSEGVTEAVANTIGRAIHTLNR